MRVFINSGLSGVLYEFDFPDRYLPIDGTSMGEAEAAALNRLLAENVSRNKTAGVRRLESGVGGVLTIADLAGVHADLVGYLTGYQLAPVPSDRRGDIEREAEAVAAERECHCGVGNCVNCRTEGRRRVLAKAGIAQKALEGL